MAKVEIGQAASGTSVRVAVGDEMEITLSETRTAGYAWRVASPASALLAVEDLGFARAPGVGGTGTHRWRVTAKQAGSATLELAYGRSWEQASPAKKFTVAIEAA
jgi:predicted secreted protein